MSLVIDRRTQVDTFYGLTEQITLVRGVDQGDCILPLLWVLFYEPLLERINKESKGYTMKAIVKLDLRYTYESTKIIEIKELAYMDDSAWLVNSKQSMEHKVQLVKSFSNVQHQIESK